LFLCFVFAKKKDNTKWVDKKDLNAA